MSENKKTQIRQADNKVKIEGILKEISLSEGKNDKNIDIISGDVVILTGEHSEHSVSVYVAKETKDGKENRAFKGISTVMKEYVSIAALLKDGRTMEEAKEMATKIRVGNAQLSLNEFYSNDDLISRPRISSNFFNRIEDNSFDPKAEFEIECYFEKVRKEMKDSEETGRLLIDAIVPMYGGTVVPMEFVADGGVAEYLENNYETKKTGRIWGEIVNIAERVVTKKSGFGKDKEDITVNYTRELVITGGNEEQYDDDSEKAYSAKQIKEAWKIRESETLPALLKKSKDKDKGAKTDSGKKASKASKAAGFTY